nr:ABC transporter ATP-binding protein [Microbacterium jejuense]
MPSDLEIAASVAAAIVVPPKPPLPAAAQPSTAETEAPAVESPAAEAEAPVAEAAAPTAESEAPTAAPAPEAPEAESTPAPAPSAAEPIAAPVEQETDAEPAAAASTHAPVVVPTLGAAAGEALVLRGVTKRFGSTHAVDGIDLTVPVGTFYGLVGPNGAGKTTTLSMIAGLLEPDRGTIEVGGVDAAAHPLAAKKLMGVLPDRLRTFDRLTGRQLLYYYGVLRGLPPAVVESRTADLARAFDLQDALGRSVSDYSAGMLKKVMLAGAMIHSPRVLVLDEPFEAVDPVSSAIILDILSAYVAHGGTVILSSHGMELVERVCSRVAVIVAGQVLAEGTVDEVRGELTLEQRFVELAGGLSDVEGLEWLHTFSG